MKTLTPNAPSPRAASVHTQIPSHANFPCFARGRVRYLVRGNAPYELLKLPAIGNRGYTNEVRLRGLKRRARILKPAQAGFVCVAAVSNRQAPFNYQILGDFKKLLANS